MLAALRLRPRWPTRVVRSKIATEGSLTNLSITAPRSSPVTEPSNRRYPTPRKKGCNTADSVTSRAVLSRSPTAVKQHRVGKACVRLQHVAGHPKHTRKRSIETPFATLSSRHKVRRYLFLAAQSLRSPHGISFTRTIISPVAVPGLNAEPL